MQPETHLFLTAVAIHRELLPLLSGLPNHRRLIRRSFGTPEGDLEFLSERFGADHPDRVDIEAAAMFAWLPASATPTTLDLVDAYR